MKDDINQPEKINIVCDRLIKATIAPIVNTSYRTLKIHEDMRLLAAKKAYAMQSPHLRSGCKDVKLPEEYAKLPSNEMRITALDGYRIVIVHPTKSPLIFNTITEQFKKLELDTKDFGDYNFQNR